MTAKRRLTEQELEQRRAQDRQLLKNAAKQLLTSEGWQRWVQVRARRGLARLSLNNQLLVALACPDATFVAGFTAWLKLGYCQVKGSKAIRSWRGCRSASATRRPVGSSDRRRRADVA